MKARYLLLCALALAACTQSPTSARTPEVRRADTSAPSHCEKGGITLGGGQIAPCP